MFSGRRRAEVRLQRDVAEILKAQHAQFVRVVKDRRHRDRNLLQQPRDRHEWHRRELDRALVQGQDDRFVALHQHTEVATIRGIAGEGHHGRDAGRQAVQVEVLLESWVHVS